MSAPTELLKGNATVLILSCLARGPLHGYGIVKALDSMSESYFQMREGTLYPHLHRMEEDGLIEGYWEQASGTRERRMYRITAKGNGELARLQAEWRKFQLNMNHVLDQGATA
ncbi:MAG: helix-turn-helix transcriptional regulator [Armatimonadota bacterium]